VFGIAQRAVNPPAAAARAPCSNGLDILTSWFAEVAMDVDKTGRDNAIGTVNLLQLTSIAAHFA
jgi:hypothetical protein